MMIAPAFLVLSSNNMYQGEFGQDEDLRRHERHSVSPGLEYCLGCHHTGDHVACKECHCDR